MNSYSTSRQTVRRVGIPLLIVIGLLVFSMAARADSVTIDPDVNNFALAEGETFNETITVTIPEGSGVGKVDVYLLADTTGSMGGPINAVKAGATTVVDDLIASLPGVDIQFGVGDYKDFQSPTQFDPYAFRHSVSITDDTTVVKNAINGWSATGGADIPEGQFYALDQLAEDRAPSNDGSPAGAIGWRADSKKIIVLFGDAPGHDPVCSAITAQVNGHAVPYDITEASVTAKFVSGAFTFIGISTLTGPGLDADPGSAQDYLNACGATTFGTAGQATRLASATGGQHILGVTAATIVDAIVDSVTTAITTINNLSLVATGDTAAFVSSIGPAGYGPLPGDTEHVLTFNVDWLGVVACTDEDQVFTGTLNVVADGVVVAHKTVTITVPGCPEEIDGRMTGGGSVFTDSGVRVTHGFALHCDAASGPNNLQINWGQGRDSHRFHLEELTWAACSDDPGIDPAPPAAPFDTYRGEGTGRYNNVAGATAEWIFTDAGQPGKNDEATIRVWDPDGNLVLSVSGTLNNGNHQAHSN